LPPLTGARRDPLDGLAGQGDDETGGDRALVGYAAAAEALNRSGLAAAVPDGFVVPLRRAGLTVWPVGGEEAA
jgi:hypothetical protein